MSSATVYLVSGATRGIGFGLVKALVLRDNVVIFAGARDFATATDLLALAKEYPNKIHVVKLVSASKEDSEAAAALVQKVAGHVDVVIANAAFGAALEPVHEIPVSEVERHFQVNTIGPLVLLQSFYPLLKAAPATPKFVVISSVAGSIQVGTAHPLHLFAYGASKAAVNFLARKVHFENEHLISFALHPGAVDTDGTRTLIKSIPEVGNIPRITVEESANGILARIDEATREKTGGTFVDNDGNTIPW
ncbi:hypothetical protein PLICRDRAFT_107378 [Plicaturopsis crispa FD-325 SS-3]|nr:hypothetical protein PLICRDRAFT_107378 [Plicaturopsis crispa FD-325 SS-3]